MDNITGITQVFFGDSSRSERFVPSSAATDKMQHVPLPADEAPKILDPQKKIVSFPQMVLGPRTSLNPNPNDPTRFYQFRSLPSVSTDVGPPPKTTVAPSVCSEETGTGLEMLFSWIADVPPTGGEQISTGTGPLSGGVTPGVEPSSLGTMLEELFDQAATVDPLDGGPTAGVRQKVRMVVEEEYNPEKLPSQLVEQEKNSNNAGVVVKMMSNAKDVSVVEESSAAVENSKSTKKNFGTVETVDGCNNNDQTTCAGGGGTKLGGAKKLDKDAVVLGKKIVKRGDVVIGLDRSSLVKPKSSSHKTATAAAAETSWKNCFTGPQEPQNRVMVVGPTSSLNISCVVEPKEDEWISSKKCQQEEAWISSKTSPSPSPRPKGGITPVCTTTGASSTPALKTSPSPRPPGGTTPVCTTTGASSTPALSSKTSPSPRPHGGTTPVCTTTGGPFTSLEKERGSPAFLFEGSESIKVKKYRNKKGVIEDVVLTGFPVVDNVFDAVVDKAVVDNVFDARAYVVGISVISLLWGSKISG